MKSCTVEEMERDRDLIRAVLWPDTPTPELERCRGDPLPMPG